VARMAEREFLLEVRCEEIPARMLTKGIRSLATRFFEELVAANLVPAEVITGFTPRRLVLCLRGVPEREPDQREQVVGPPVKAAFRDGEPTAALIGFAERCGVEPEMVHQVETEKGLYLAVEQTRRGRRTIDVLAELVPRLLQEIHWPKVMHWGSGLGPWVRPVHGLLAIYGGEIVPCELFGVPAGNTTIGHPLHSPAEFRVGGYDDYVESLRGQAIEAQFDARRRILLDAARGEAEAAGGRLVEDDALLDKLAAICSIPGLVRGSFDAVYLDLPREVLETSLRDHQSALTIEGEDGLLPSFLTVMDRHDDPEGLVRAGNEWVVVARLADAEFFWNEDRKQSLAAMGERLEHLSFHARLGSYADKRGRLTELVSWLAGQLGWDEEETAAAVRAAGLLKVDLTTEMVKEFTSLQGVMGGIYAREDDEPQEVWQAIYDQYLPVSTSDSLPRDAVGRLVSVADRLDTLAGMFGIGLVPTGSRDPFGLRRSAQGLIRILLEGELPIDPVAAFGEALNRYGENLNDAEPDDVLATLSPFLQDRIRHLLGLQDFAYDEIEAGLHAGWRDLPDLKARVAAIHASRDQPGFGEVVLAAKRIANILREQPDAELDEDLLQEAAERDLHAAQRELAGEIAASASARDYERGLAAVARFADVLERFFVEVLVMDENPDLRRNRLALLQETQRSLNRIAALQEIVMDRSEEREAEIEEGTD
jgi:glycyl-tRNA synthetase beta chain